MKSLVIDATNRYLIFALTERDQAVYAYCATLTQKNLVSHCVQILDTFLNDNHTPYNALERIYVNLGPGSFTGVKAGLNMAKTIWSVYPHIQIFVANSLEILDHRGSIGIVDARGGKDYIMVDGEVQMWMRPAVQVFCDQHPGRKVVRLEELQPDEYVFTYLLPALAHFRHVADPLALEPLYVRPAV